MVDTYPTAHSTADHSEGGETTPALVIHRDTRAPDLPLLRPNTPILVLAFLLHI